LRGRDSLIVVFVRSKSSKIKATFDQRGGHRRSCSLVVLLSDSSFWVGSEELGLRGRDVGVVVGHIVRLILDDEGIRARWEELFVRRGGLAVVEEARRVRDGLASVPASKRSGFDDRPRLRTGAGFEGFASGHERARCVLLLSLSLPLPLHHAPRSCCWTSCSSVVVVVAGRHVLVVRSRSSVQGSSLDLSKETELLQLRRGESSGGRFGSGRSRRRVRRRRRRSRRSVVRIILLGKESSESLEA